MEGRGFFFCLFHELELQLNRFFSSFVKKWLWSNSLNLRLDSNHPFLSLFYVHRPWPFPRHQPTLLIFYYLKKVVMFHCAFAFPLLLMHMFLADLNLVPLHAVDGVRLAHPLLFLSLFLSFCFPISLLIFVTIFSPIFLLPLPPFTCIPFLAFFLFSHLSISLFYFFSLSVCLRF